MPFDAWRGYWDINYNEQLDAPSAPFETEENGWTEEVYFPISTNEANVRQQMRNLVAARCGLMARNQYIFRAKFGKLSQKGDSYDLFGMTTVPVFDADEPSGTVEACNSIDDGVQFRFEDGLGRRWNRLIRGVRDSWLYNREAHIGVQWCYDSRHSALPAPYVVGATPGTAATATATVAAGAVTGFGALVGGAGYTSPPPVFLIGGGYTTIATAHTTIAAGVVTAIVLDSGGAGYTGAPTVLIPAPQSGAWAIQAGQTSQQLLENFLACLKAYCIDFHTVKVANSAFPSGYMPQGDTIPPGGAPYVPSRILLVKGGNRQTGRIKKTKNKRSHALI